MLLQKLWDLWETGDRGKIQRRITDANPPGVSPAGDVIAAAIENGIIGELRIMASNELEDFPQAVCVLRQIAEEIGFNSIERDHDLTRKR